MFSKKNIQNSWHMSWLFLSAQREWSDLIESKKGPTYVYSLKATLLGGETVIPMPSISKINIAFSF